MVKLLYAAGTAFLRAFGASLLIFSTGILSAPNMSVALSLSIAALLASIAAGLRAIQVFIPQLSFASLVRQPVAAWLDSFTRAALSAFVVSATGWLAAPDMANWRSVWIGVIIGAVAAGIRALQGLLTPGEQPAPSKGLGDLALT
jgi:hypothetical protein